MGSIKIAKLLKEEKKLKFTDYPGLAQAADDFQPFKIVDVVKDPGYGYDHVRLFLIQFIDKSKSGKKIGGSQIGGNYGVCIWDTKSKEFIEEPSDLEDYNTTLDKLKSKYGLKPGNLNEVYYNKDWSITNVLTWLKEFATSKNVEAKLITKEKKPTGYGGSMTLYDFKIGNLKVVVVDDKVAGAPRLNEIRVIIGKEIPGEKWKVTGVALTSMSGGKETVIKNLESRFVAGDSTGSKPAGGEKAAAWTQEKLKKELASLQQGAKEAGDIDDAAAWDIADSWLADNPGVETAIKKYYPKVSDFKGFVANYIA